VLNTDVLKPYLLLIGQAQNQIEQQLGFPLKDVERVTLVTPEDENFTTYYAVLSFAKPYDQAKLLALLNKIKPTQQKQHQGKSYYALPIPPNQAAPVPIPLDSVAVHFLNEKTIVAGPEPALHAFFAMPPQAGVKGQLSDALGLAAQDH